MLKKHGKWFADWFDAKGSRRRKALPSKRAALAFQTEQRRKVHAETHTRPTRRRTR
jgi:hypothetical protein